MKPSILRNLTWEDILEIVIETEAVFDDEVQEGRNPNETFQSPETYYKEVLRRLRGQNGIPPPIEGRFHTVLRTAEQATSWMLTDTRERENTLIRSFVAYKLHNEGYSCTEIGKVMHRDHSTITHLANRMRDMLSLPVMYRQEIGLFREFERILNE